MNYPNEIFSLIAALQKRLNVVYQDETMCRQYAWWTLEFILKKNEAALIAQGTITLTTNEEQQLDHWLHKMIDESMPIQYLIGSVPFADLEILVEPPILIPRPETEEWCMTLSATLKTLTNKRITILDLCSGTGCIALTLAKALPQATIYAIDINEQAIALGKKNAQHNNITNIVFVQSDLFHAIPTGITFDLIVSNPPYIAENEWSRLSQSVTRWEDRNALIAYDNGLSIIKKIIQQAPHYVTTNIEMKHLNIPQLVLEIGYAQKNAVTQLMQAADFTMIQTYKDLEGKDRVVQGRVDNVAATKHS